MKKTITIMEYYSGVRTYKVEAKDVDEAISMIQECNVEPTDGFETTNDVEVVCSGEENEDGEIEYY